MKSRELFTAKIALTFCFFLDLLKQLFHFRYEDWCCSRTYAYSSRAVVANAMSSKTAEGGEQSDHRIRCTEWLERDRLKNNQLKTKFINSLATHVSWQQNGQKWKKSILNETKPICSVLFFMNANFVFVFSSGVIFFGAISFNFVYISWLFCSFFSFSSSHFATITKPCKFILSERKCFGFDFKA